MRRVENIDPIDPVAAVTMITDMAMWQVNLLWYVKYLSCKLYIISFCWMWSQACQKLSLWLLRNLVHPGAWSILKCTDMCHVTSENLGHCQKHHFDSFCTPDNSFLEVSPKKKLEQRTVNIIKVNHVWCPLKICLQQTKLPGSSRHSCQTDGLQRLKMSCVKLKVADAMYLCLYSMSWHTYSEIAFIPFIWLCDSLWAGLSEFQFAGTSISGFLAFI